MPYLAGGHLCCNQVFANFGLNVGALRISGLSGLLCDSNGRLGFYKGM